MSLPPLYKYLDVRGARLTLENGSFRHAKPSEFNDTEDLTIRSIFPESDEEALEEIKNSFSNVILNNLDKKPTCSDPTTRQKLLLIQETYRRNPDTAKLINEIQKNTALSNIYQIDEIRAKSKAFVDEINAFMQGFRVLCVSANGNSEHLWNRYAQNAEGIALRILPNVEKDSKFLMFHKVQYQARRPPLYENILKFIEGGFFENQEKRALDTIHQIIYSKTLEWAYECEYRLAIPILDGSDWNTMPYHADEITELYFGKSASNDTKAELTELAIIRNPRIKIFHAVTEPSGRIIFLS